MSFLCQGLTDAHLALCLRHERALVSSLVHLLALRVHFMCKPWLSLHSSQCRLAGIGVCILIRPGCCSCLSQQVALGSLLLTPSGCSAAVGVNADVGSKGDLLSSSRPRDP